MPGFSLVKAKSEAERAWLLQSGCIVTKKYAPRSPAMAIGLANSILSIREILLTPVYPPKGWE
jgi:hypothetical protein